MFVTYVKCTDCGLMKEKINSLKEMGILEGNNCPNCGGEVVQEIELLVDGFR